jgi:hypothetical protein
MSKLRSLKRKIKNRPDADALLRKKLKSSDYADRKLIRNPPGKEKMSEVIMEFIEPIRLKNKDETVEELKNLLMVGITAWNLAILVEQEKDTDIEAILDKLDMDRANIQFTKEVIKALMERKKSLFSKHDRMIAEFEVVDRGKDLHISVASISQ